MPLVLEQVDVAAPEAHALAQAPGDGRHDLVDLERRRQLEARIGDQREPLGGLVEIVKERGVADRLGGDLPEATQKVDVFPGSRLVGIQVGQADDVALHHQRQVHHPAKAPFDGVRTVEIGRPRIVDHIGHRDGHHISDGDPPEGVVGEPVAQADVRRLTHALFHRSNHPHHVALCGVNLALLAAGDLAHAVADRVQHLVQVQRGAEGQARVDEQAQLLSALFEALDQQRVVERPSDDRRHALQEVATLRPVTRLDVEDVDRADDAVFDHQRHADLALQPELGHAPAFIGREPLVVEALDDERLTGHYRAFGRRERGESARPAHPLVGIADLVEPGEQVQPTILDRVDLARVGSDRLDQALSHGADDHVGVARLRRQSADVDEMVEHRVVALGHCEQQRLLQ